MRKTLLALLLAAASAPAAAQQRSTSTFVHLTSSQWMTLDPANAFDSVSFILVGNVYEPLVAFKSVDHVDQFEPFLAEKVPTVENGLLSRDRLIYRFPIRKGVKFHDGSEMTAEDVRYSLLRFMLTDTEGGPAALLLKPVLGIYSTRDAQGRLAVDFKAAAAAVRVEGDSVVVRLAKPDETFLSVLASLPIVTSRAWAASHGEWDGAEPTWKKFNGRADASSYFHEHADGTGPFRLEQAQREEVVLRRHDGYWRKPAALSSVSFRVVPNAGLRLFLLETGDADAGYLEYSYRGYLPHVKGVKVVEDPAPRKLGELLFFTFKVDAAGNDLLGSGKLDGAGIPPDFFSDPDVRAGFSYAFDYDRFLKQALGGHGTRVGSPFPPALFDTGKPAFSHDSAKAESALRKAFGGKLWESGFVLPIPASSDDEMREIAAEVMKESLEKLNPKFRVRLFAMDSRRFFQEVEARRLPLYVGGYYADYPDPQAFAFGLLHSQGYFPKFQGYSNPEADALVEQAARAPERQAREALYKRLSEIAAKDVPQIYTYSPAVFKVCRDWVQGFDSRANVSNLKFNGFPYFYAYSKAGPK